MANRNPCHFFFKFHICKGFVRENSGFLVGQGVSLADVRLLELLLATEDYFGPDYIKTYPKITVIKLIVKEKSLIQGSQI